MASSDDTANVSDETEKEEEREANASHEADRGPTEDEAAAAPDSVDKSVAEHHDEANKTGANVKGEGEI